MIRIVRVKSDNQIEHIRILFKEYQESLGFDLSFQKFAKELTELPGEYAPPDGCLMLAIQGKQAVGCVALRKIKDNICEMKRLYIRSAFRRKGIGRRLAVRIIAEAHKIGYTHMRLDTIGSMVEANALYESLGFKKIKPYRYNPISGALYMELVLG